MERLAIIDHDDHRLFIEDVSDEVLAKYDGEEEEYIKDNYDMENYSWDYIILAEAILPNGDVIEIEMPEE